MYSETNESTIRPIARVLSPFEEKFGIPRQPGLVPAARGHLVMLDGYDRAEAFEGLDGFSHLWVIFGFHACDGKSGLRVRPPRLGGNREMGVFATRSPFRPNNLGLSVLCLEAVEIQGGRVRLAVSGLDLLDGTPIYDIKPYIPYTDAMPEARAGFARGAPEAVLEVVFDEGVVVEADLAELITQTLSLDPRPAYRRDEPAGRVYGMRLAGHEVRWVVEGGRARVVELV